MMKMKILQITTLCLLILMAFPAYAQEEVGVSSDVINAYPEPNVTPLIPNDSLLYDRIYRRANDPLTIHDAPGGSKRRRGSGKRLRLRRSADGTTGLAR